MTSPRWPPRRSSGPAWLTRKRRKPPDRDQSTAGQAIAKFTDFMALYPNDPRVPQAQKIIASLKGEQARGNFAIARVLREAQEVGGRADLLQRGPVAGSQFAVCAPKRGNALTNSSSSPRGRASSMRLLSLAAGWSGGARRERLRRLQARAGQRPGRAREVGADQPVRQSDAGAAPGGRGHGPTAPSSCSAMAPTSSPPTTTGTSWSAVPSPAISGRRSASRRATPSPCATTGWS